MMNSSARGTNCGSTVEAFVEAFVLRNPLEQRVVEAWKHFAEVMRVRARLPARTRATFNARARIKDARRRVRVKKVQKCFHCFHKPCKRLVCNRLTCGSIFGLASIASTNASIASTLLWRVAP